MSRPAKAAPPQFDFSATLRSITEKRRLIPLIRAYLSDPSFLGFSIPVEPWDNRQHDGWWHPSTHALWGERKLFLYLTEPDHVLGEAMGPEGVKAVTSGKFWHMFYQHILAEVGVLECAELPLFSERYRVRGHADGELKNDRNYQNELLEIKTINEFQVDKVVNVDVLRDKKPEYYAQSQVYLFLRFGFGVGQMRYLVVHPGYPFKESEFTVEADEVFQRRLMKTYRRVWLAVQAHQAREAEYDDLLPDPCDGCGVGRGKAKVCELRLPCDIGGPE